MPSSDSDDWRQNALPVPPLVSVIIVNYNYGHFLRATVASVTGQTYPRIECIVVDNASTDGSGELLAELEAVDPELRVLRRADNGGQTAASLDGLRMARGQYVVFLDADDLLLPTGVETHVLAHLSMRIAVGFTSGDMLQLVDDEVVTATGAELNRYVRSGKGRRRRNIVRPFDNLWPALWPGGSRAAHLADRLHYVPPHKPQWVWSPTSGNCYRRDALRLFEDNAELAQLRTGTDMFFNVGISGLSGSVLIDEPVFAYRIHSSNIFSRFPQLDRIQCYEAGGVGDNNDRARRAVIDHFVQHADRFASTQVLKLNFAWMLIRLDVGHDDPHLPRWARRSRAASQIVAYSQKLSSVLGPTLTKGLMIWLGVPLGTALRAPT